MLCGGEGPVVVSGVGACCRRGGRWSTWVGVHLPTRVVVQVARNVSAIVSVSVCVPVLAPVPNTADGSTQWVGRGCLQVSANV